MSGFVELLLIPAAAGGAWGWLTGKLEQNRERDQKDLVFDADQVQLLSEALTLADTKMREQHSASAGIWRGPLSLFGKRQEEQAAKDEVPEWAVASVNKMKRLVDSAAELGDRTDVYQTQLRVAAENSKSLFGKRLLRQPVEGHIEQLEELTRNLTLQNESLEKARAAFDNPRRAPKTDPEASVTDSNSGKSRFGCEALRCCNPRKRGHGIAVTNGQDRCDEAEADPSALTRVHSMASRSSSSRSLPARSTSMSILREEAKVGIVYRDCREKAMDERWGLHKIDWGSLLSMAGNASADFYRQKELLKEAQKRAEEERVPDPRQTGL